MRRLLGAWAVGLVLTGALAAASRPEPPIAVEAAAPAPTRNEAAPTPPTTALNVRSAGPTTTGASPAPTTGTTSPSTASTSTSEPSTTPTTPTTAPEAPGEPSTTVPDASTTTTVATHPPVRFRGYVRDTAGNPVAGVCVGAHNYAPGRGRTVLATSAADGGYDVLLVANKAGEWGPEPTYLEVWSCSPHPDGYRLRFSIEAPMGPDATLHWDYSVWWSGRLQGQVVDESGTGVGGILVRHDWREVTTEPDGSYVFRDATPGPGAVTVPLGDRVLAHVPVDVPGYAVTEVPDIVVRLPAG